MRDFWETFCRKFYLFCESEVDPERQISEELFIGIFIYSAGDFASNLKKGFLDNRSDYVCKTVGGDGVAGFKLRFKKFVLGFALQNFFILFFVVFCLSI